MDGSSAREKRRKARNVVEATRSSPVSNDVVTAGANETASNLAANNAARHSQRRSKRAKRAAVTERETPETVNGPSKEEQETEEAQQEDDVIVHDRQQGRSRNGKKRKRARDGKSSTPKSDAEVSNIVDGKRSKKETDKSCHVNSSDEEAPRHPIVPPNVQKAIAEHKSLRAQVSGLRTEKARLLEQVKTLELSLTERNDTLEHVQTICTCTICMELAWRPHVLSPCGHMFCARCLVMWFKRPAPTEDPMPHYFSPEQRAAEERKRNVRRVKVCPHCRVKVLAQPAEIWTMKSMIETLDAANQSIEEKDRQQAGIENTVPTEAELRDTGSAMKQKRGEDLPTGTALWADIFDMRLARQPIWDVDDQVYRCGSCSSEILDHQCTNPQCLMMYHPDDFGDDLQDAHADDGLAEQDWVNHRILDENPWGHENEWSGDEDEEWDEDDEDFIDDAELSDNITNGSEVDHLSENGSADESDVQEVDQAGRPLNNNGRRRIVATIPDTDEEGGDEEDDEPIQAPRRRHASPRHLPFSDEEPDDATDAVSASTPSIYLGSEEENGELDDDNDEQDDEEQDLQDDAAINFEEPITESAEELENASGEEWSDW